MSLAVLWAGIEPDQDNDNGVKVCAPAVGYLGALVDVGAHLDDQSQIGVLTILGRRHLVMLPRGVCGWVSARLVEGRQAPVAFGQPLLRLTRNLPAATAATVATSRVDQLRSDTPVDRIVVKAPSDGVFYRRPAPDAPPLVEVGTVVRSGQLLGLIEVMKCFHQITFAGPVSSSQGTVVEILADDAAEVRFAQTLFLIEPTGRAG